jgi:hypothetical protein
MVVIIPLALELGKRAAAAAPADDAAAAVAH